MGDFDSTSCLRVAVIGGGAAGFFAAISTAELNPSAEVVLFESGKKVLRKVKLIKLIGQSLEGMHLLKHSLIVLSKKSVIELPIKKLRLIKQHKRLRPW